MLLNFEDDVEVQVIQAPRAKITVTPRPIAQSYMLKDQWGWEDLRDYVVSCIETTHGPFPRNAIKEASIFKSFFARWEAKEVGSAKAIAETAFGIHHGMWANAPISVNRFCKSSDPFFAESIMKELAAAL
jgi:hypothetical protein